MTEPVDFRPITPPDDDSDSEDMKFLTSISQLKTLTQFYASGTLKAASSARYSHNPQYLDKVTLWQGDITKLGVDSIVNAANKSLLGGGGGRTLNGCDTGNSKITKGYKLPAKHIIHTVGPIYSSSDVPNRAAQLASCYRTSLQVALENQLKHIAFPSVSTGIYGYPIEDATHIALDIVRQFLDDPSALVPDSSLDNLDRIIFVVWSDKDKGVYENLIPEYFPPSGDTDPVDEGAPQTVAVAPETEAEVAPQKETST